MRTGLLLAVALVFAVGYAAAETPCHELAPKFSMYLDMTSGMYEKAMTGNAQKTKYCTAVSEILAALDEGGNDKSVETGTAATETEAAVVPAKTPLAPSNCDHDTEGKCNKDPSCEFHETSGACKPKCDSIGENEKLCLATEIDMANTAEAAKHSSCFFCEGKCQATRVEGCKNTEFFDKTANEKGVAEKKTRLDKEISQLVASLNALSICSDEQSHLVENAEKYKNTAADATEHVDAIWDEVDALSEQQLEQHKAFKEHTQYLSGAGDDPSSVSLTALNTAAEAKLAAMNDHFKPNGNAFVSGQIDARLNTMMVAIRETIGNMEAEDAKMKILYKLVVSPNDDKSAVAKALLAHRNSKPLVVAKLPPPREVTDVAPVTLPELNCFGSNGVAKSLGATFGGIDFGDKFARKARRVMKGTVDAWCQCAIAVKEGNECNSAEYVVIEGTPSAAQAEKFLTGYQKAVAEGNTGGLEADFTK